MSAIAYPTTVGSDIPTSERAIRDFEQQYGVRLPKVYVGFLLMTNGGRPNKLAYPIAGLADVDFFMGLAPQSETFDLRRYLDIFAGRIPADFVLVGVNGGVDYICLDLRDGGERVVFWDHAHFWSTGEWREGDLYFIANSFQEFLTSLRPNPY